MACQQTVFFQVTTNFKFQFYCRLISLAKELKPQEDLSILSQQGGQPLKSYFILRLFMLQQLLKLIV